MPRSHPLPLSPDFTDVESYVQSLLAFVTASELFQKLCGGVHILDFLTNEPDLYSNLLPQEWRDWLQHYEVSDFLDLLMDEDVSSLYSLCSFQDQDSVENKPTWRQGPMPPKSLVGYIITVRKHALDRHVTLDDDGPHVEHLSQKASLPRHVAVGMNPKKIHEVESFVRYIDDLIVDIESSSPYAMTHIVDFGSGQNYLGRALASPPLNKNIIAVESKQRNIVGAKSMDVMAKITEKEIVLRNKKKYRNELAQRVHVIHASSSKPAVDLVSSYSVPSRRTNHPNSNDSDDKKDDGKGNIHYVETLIQNGDLSTVVARIKGLSLSRDGPDTSNLQLLVISLHSCGSLLHHGLRSLILNSTVKAVAMVGCCYNLLTERLGPPTYKSPSLHSANERRRNNTSSANDLHGFPMSERLATFKYQNGEGVRFNITARMMAVQAPENWTATECESFFKRHFFRALLQRIFLDRGVINKPAETGDTALGGSPRGWTGTGAALTIGSLRKACYLSFVTYVRGAIAKLKQDPQRGPDITRCMEDITDEEILLYEEKYKERKKHLSIVWSLMAFSASVVESTIVVDRWLYLKEQNEVKDCWVEAVFDYKQSPRNLVVVGIKK